MLRTNLECVRRIKILEKILLNWLREVYFNNDKRAKIKKEMNKILGSNIREVKQYIKY